MAFGNDLSIDADHHTPHANADADADTYSDENATLLGGRGNNTINTSTSASRVSRFRLVGFMIGVVALSLSAFVFLLNQGTSSSSLSSVSVINSNNNGADMKDNVVTGSYMRSNYVWFIDGNRKIVKTKFAYQPSSYMVTKGQPYGGVLNANDGKLLVKAGRVGSTPVADAFNSHGDKAFSFIRNKCVTIIPNPCSDDCYDFENPTSLNFYVVVDLQIEGIGTINNIALGQGHTSKVGNDWWINSPDCHFVYDPDYYDTHSVCYDDDYDYDDATDDKYKDDNQGYLYQCKLTNGKYFTLSSGSRYDDHVFISSFGPQKD